MSARLIVRNFPRNLTQEGLVKVFSDLRGLINCSLHINPQNEVYSIFFASFSSNSYGIVEFSSVELADYARKVKSNFKLLGSPYPINIDFFYPQSQQEFYPGANSMNTPSPNLNSIQNIQSHPNISNTINQIPIQENFSNYNKTEFPGHNINYQSPNQPHHINEMEGPMSQDIYMQQQFQHPHPQQQCFPLENTQNPEMFNVPQNSNYNYSNQNQYMQPGINSSKSSNIGSAPSSQSSMMGMPGNMNFSNASMSTNSSLNSPSMKNYQPIPMINNPGKGFPMNPPLHSQNPNLNPNPNPQFFNAPQGGYNPSSFAGKMMNMKNSSNQSLPGGKPSVEEDLELFKVPSKATSSIYVDGIPIDSTEREVSHLFRPFPGFKVVRLIKKESKTGRKFYFCFVDFENSLQSTIALYTLQGKFYFCFVDFENSLQSTIALYTLQGYRFDKSDKKGLKISYAFHTQDSNRPSQHKGPLQSYR